MASSILTLDTLDDRREIWELLNRLPPASRICFLQWCCFQVAPPGTSGPRPDLLAMLPLAKKAARDNVKGRAANKRLTNALYGDLMVLASQYEMDLKRAAEELEQWIRRPNRRLEAMGLQSKRR